MVIGIDTKEAPHVLHLLDNYDYPSYLPTNKNQPLGKKFAILELQQSPI